MLAVAAVCATALPRLRFRHDTRALLRADATEDRLEATLTERFGSEDLLLVAWEVDDALAPVSFRRTRAFAQRLESIPGIEEIYSIASPTVLLPIGLPLRPIREEDLTTEAGRTRIANALADAPLYLGTICNAERTVVACAGTIKAGPVEDREATVRSVRALAREFETPGRPVYVSGVTALALAASEYALEDLKRVGGAALAVSLLALLLLCGSVRETVVAVVATALPPLYALGLASLFSWPITALGAALFPVLGVVGITSTVHLLNQFEKRRADPAATVTAAAWGAARDVARPVSLSLLTTAGAFYSLHVTGVPAFEAAGLIVSSGVALAIPVVLLGVPAALVLVRPGAGRHAARRIDGPLRSLSRWVRRAPRVLLACGFATLLLFAPLATRASVEVNVLQAFSVESRIARTYRFIEERLTATLPVDIVWTPPQGTPSDVVLTELRELEKQIVAIDGVDSALGVQSLVDYGRSIVPLNDEAALAFLRTRGLARITARFEDRASGSYRVKVRVHEGTPPTVLDQIEKHAHAVRPGPTSVTGLYVRAVHTTRALVDDLFRGILLMVVVVVLVTIAAYRSWRFGLAALLPNALPPAAVFGGAALVGFPLDVSAVAVGAVAVGLAIDNTFHVLDGVAREARSGVPLPMALDRTQRSVGRALVVSTAVLMAGLVCLRASAFLPTAQFGTLASLSCLVALGGDLILLPAALLLLRRL